MSYELARWRASNKFQGFLMVSDLRSCTMLSTLPLFYIAQSVNSDDRRTRIQGLRVIMFPSCSKSLLQSEATQLKVIFTRMVLLLASFWKWEFSELRNSLLAANLPPFSQEKHFLALGSCTGSTMRFDWFIWLPELVKAIILLCHLPKISVSKLFDFSPIKI